MDSSERRLDLDRRHDGFYVLVTLDDLVAIDDLYDLDVLVTLDDLDALDDLYALHNPVAHDVLNNLVELDIIQIY